MKIEANKKRMNRDQFVLNCMGGFIIYTKEREGLV